MKRKRDGDDADGDPPPLPDADPPPLPADPLVAGRKRTWDDAAAAPPLPADEPPLPADEPPPLPADEPMPPSPPVDAGAPPIMAPNPVPFQLDDADADADDDDDDASSLSPRDGAGAGDRSADAAELSASCPYLASVNRQVLDFDFEKLCSVSLTNLNVYACLVCGRYFQGRGPQSHAYFHSLQESHHVFLSLESGKIYCLPDDYEVVDSSLSDIQYLLNPRFTKEQIATLDANTSFYKTIHGDSYLPGVVGLNNLKETDFATVVIQGLNRVKPLRDALILEGLVNKSSSDLAQRLAQLLRKLWNPRNFKAHVSPHEFLQAITLASKKKFKIGTRSDPKECLVWLLNTLHRDLGGTRAAGSSIIHKALQGQVAIRTARPTGEQEEVEAENPQDRAHKPVMRERFETTVETRPFLFLTLDIPAAPLFKDALERNMIPQVPLFVLLQKFDGETIDYLVTGERRQYSIKQLPQYLILHLKRFTHNKFFVEKNPTIVTFPLRNLDMRPYLSADAPEQPSKYNLVASLCHQGTREDGSYHAHIYHEASNVWYDMRDLVVTEIMPQAVTLTEAYILIYERQHTT